MVNYFLLIKRYTSNALGMNLMCWGIDTICILLNGFSIDCFKQMKKIQLTVHVNCRGNNDERDDDNRADQRHAHLITALQVRRKTLRFRLTSHTVIMYKTKL